MVYPATQLSQETVQCSACVCYLNNSSFLVSASSALCGGQRTADLQRRRLHWEQRQRGTVADRAAASGRGLGTPRLARHLSSAAESSKAELQSIFSKLSIFAVPNSI